MTDAPAPLTPFVTWLISLLVPLALIVLSVRLIMTPLFLQVEYRAPGFPPDPYGFTLEDRLYWSEISLDVLVNLREISFVEGLQFEDGSPVYNQRELGHWVDAINLWRNVSRVGYGATIIFMLFGAPDLALTQFAIETLTVILLVLVIYRLPRFGRRQ